MNTLKLKVITSPGTISTAAVYKYTAVGINRDSQLCYMTTPHLMKHFEKTKFVTITQTTSHSSRNGIYIDISPNSKVCDYCLYYYIG